MALSRNHNQIFRGPQLAIKTGLFGPVTHNLWGQPNPEVIPEYVDIELTDILDVARFYLEGRNLDRALP